MIEMDKKYKTRNGLPVRILATNIKSPYPVVAAVLHIYNQEDVCAYTDVGKFILESDTDNEYDLIEVTPYDDFKEDDLCVVWTDDKQLKEFRYFAAIKENLPYVFDDGKTSFTSESRKVYWPNCRKATEEEIRTKTIKD